MRLTLNICTLILSCLYAGVSLCCQINTEPQYSAFISYDPEFKLMYSSQEPTFINGCKKEDWGKFLLVAMGPDIISPDYRRGNSFDGTFMDHKCEIKKNPFQSISTHEEKANYYKQQTTFMNSCFGVKVTDLGQPLRPVPQTHCQIKTLNPNQVEAFGGLCFFSMGPRSSFQVEPIINPDCQKKSYLKEKNIFPMDLNGIMGFYVAGDASGFSEDLSPLEFTQLRLTLGSTFGHGPLSADVGKDFPRWPTTFNADTYMGALKIVKNEERTELKSSILIDHRCPRACVDGMCTSPCDFSVPIGIESRLSEKIGDKVKVKSIWYQGGVAPAQWQGKIEHVHQLDLNTFQVGKRYSLTMNLKFLDSYYRLFKSEFKQFLIDYVSTGLPGEAIIEPLKPLRSLVRRYKPLPTLPKPSGMHGGRMLNAGMTKPLETLARMLGLEFWPPYYSQACDPTTNNCGPMYPKTLQLEHVLEFTVKDIQNSEVILDEVRLTRNSKIFKPYLNADALSDVVCP